VRSIDWTEDATHGWWSIACLSFGAVPGLSSSRLNFLIRHGDHALRVQLRDDGVGGAQADGSGPVGLADRLAALEGQFRVESAAGGGTLVAAAIPLRAA
jgi:nitrate/nitrite-specific signal transduction histidine kinase